MQDSTAPLSLDAIDRRLLEQLQTDASLSNQALAERTHLSPATCLRRVRRLVDAGVITRRIALVDAARLGPTLTAIAEVSLDRQGAEHLAAFAARAAADVAVQQCHQVSPGPDFVLVVQVPDMPAWQAFVQRLFTQDANVRNHKSYFVVQTAKFDPKVVLG